MADALVAGTAAILAANGVDVDAARDRRHGENVIDRLRLDADRVAAFARALRDIAALPDPVGEVVRGSTLPNGLQLQQVRVPMGVIGMIYEGRPNVTADAAAICLKAGSAVLLRGSSSAAGLQRRDHRASCVTRSPRTGLPADAIQRSPADDRSSATHLHAGPRPGRPGHPARGSGSDPGRRRASRTVPVIETGTGNCHVYVDADADLDMALDIVVNAKTQRTSVCNAAESLLVHQARRRRVRAPGRRGAARAGGDDPRRRDLPGDRRRASWRRPTTTTPPSTCRSTSRRGSWTSFDEAVVAHPHVLVGAHRGDRHAVAGDRRTRFTRGVDSAAVMVNASTRFTDGGELGFGAEIGISTQKLHARGPMGLTEMTTTTYVVTGDGHVR